MNTEIARVAPRRRTKRPAVAMVRNYAEIATQWEDDVLSGRFPAGVLVRKAVERQRSDLANPPDGYAWDKGEAGKACALAEELAFPKGPKRGERFHLEPWEVWLIAANFGWVDAVTRLPRFHRVSIWLPKGNGKSPLAAAFGNIVLARGRNIGAKVYAAAVTEKQANNVFQPAQEMLRLSPKFREAAQIVVGEHAIRGVGDARTFEKVSAEKRSADGTVGDCYIVDEVHQHPNRALYDVLSNNASKVDGSRIVVISTAGTDQSPEAIGWQLYCEAKSVLLGETLASAHFALIFEADRDRDPWDEATWRQANPNYGVSISARNFRTTAEAARAVPTAQPHFFSTRLGWWMKAASHWIAPAEWDKCADPSLKISDFAGRQSFIGCDMAVTRDLTATAHVFVEPGSDGLPRYAVFAHAYLPEESPTLGGNDALRVWARDGWLTLTPGRSMAHGGVGIARVRDDIARDAKRFPGSELCYDQTHATGLVQLLEDVGAPVTPVIIRQGAMTQGEPMQQLEAAVLDGRLRHDGNPLLAWCVGNVVPHIDRNGNVAPDKDNDAKKIDCAIALINAFVRAYITDGSDVFRPVNGGFISL